MVAMVTQHEVAEYGTWRAVYDSVQELREEHGCRGQRVLRDPADGNNLLVFHEFPTVSQAQGFVSDPGLKSAMQRAGVSSAPRIEIWEDVDG